MIKSCFGSPQRSATRQAMAIAAALWFALAGALAGSAQAAIVQVYFNNFDGTETFDGGATGGLSGITDTTGVQGYAGLGSVGNQFGGNMLRNTASLDPNTLGDPAEPTVLTLNNLPTHDSIDVDFLLAVINSWDSSDATPAEGSPDFFYIRLDGTVLLQHTYANFSGTITDLTGTDIGGGLVQRGFPDDRFLDRAFDAGTFAGLTVAHTASSVTVEWYAGGSGWQGGDDESFGLDNLRITANVPTSPVPEPATIGLFAVALAGLVVARRRSGALRSR